MKKLLALFLALALAFSAAGCSRGTRKPSASPAPSVAAESAAPGQALQVSLALWGLEPAVEGQVSADMREYIAAKFGVEFVPWPITREDWKEKLTAASVAGTLPDVFMQGVFEDRMFFKQLIDQQQIRELPESIYKNYHYLGTMMYRYRNTESVDGKLYFVPRADMASRYNNGQSTAIWYRLDWALESGLVKAGEAPSWQNFMDLMGFYAHSDPDKNGHDDTRALTSAGPGLGGLKTAFLMPFGVRDWVLEGGRWVPGILSSRAKEAVKWANQAFRGGSIDPDFATETEEDALTRFCSGQAGMLVADASPAGAARLNAMLMAKQPGLNMRDTVSVLAEPLNPWGVAYNEDTSYSTGTVFSATVDDGKLNKVFAVMDWLLSDAGLTYANWGEKGRDYNVTGDGLQTLHKDENGLPITFGELNGQWAGLASLSAWGRDFIPAAGEDDYRLKYLSTLQDFWWTNDWRRPMFTRTIFDASVQSFDAGGQAEAVLADMIVKSTDVEADWPAYVAQMNTALNVEAVAKVVNDYAQANNITTEE